MGAKVYIFDSHPVQYKAPVYQALQAVLPDGFEVIYATDATVRSGNIDKEFGREVTWDTPLLSGYRFRVLRNERGVPLSSPRSLTGRGIFQLLKSERPSAVVLTQSHYWFDHAAYFSAWLLRIPILIRQETQDEMFAGQRPWWKERLRAGIYRALYAPVQHAFAFGQLNHQHLLRHGIQAGRISFARFSVPDPVSRMSLDDRGLARDDLRRRMQVRPGAWVVAFFGKFIPKKNPELIFECLEHLPATLRARLHLMFVGTGELQADLKRLAADAQTRFGVPSSFMGFVNQSQLPPHYLAADAVVLPSRRMGEAWGLVVNEALQAGCGVVISDAVGCAAEFGHLDRVRVIPVGDAPALADSLGQLSAFERDFGWAASHLSRYSSEAAAQALGQTLARYLPPPMHAWMPG